MAWFSAPAAAPGKPRKPEGEEPASGIRDSPEIKVEGLACRAPPGAVWEGRCWAGFFIRILHLRIFVDFVIVQ